jgi:ferric-dicitrate binding protein FerR (iron transport regulator)
MNDPNDFSQQPAEDKELEAMLSPLKAIEPTLEARLANRRAVAEELSEESRWAQPTLRAESIRRPWWRRSVSVPVPLALGLAVMMALAVVSSFQNWRERPAKAPTNAGEVAIANAKVETNATTKGTVSGRPATKFYESETYLCGIGRISSESSYVFRD